MKQMKPLPQSALRVSPSIPALLPTAFLLLAAVAPAQAKKDTVRLASGDTESGTVKSEELAGLTLTLSGGKTVTYPWAQVSDVQYAGAPEFAKAVTAFTQGGIAEALPQLETLAADSKLRPVLRQQVLYYHALALQRSGRYSDALAQFQVVLSEFPKTRFLVGIADGMVACHVANGDVAGGRAALEALASKASSNGADAGSLGAIDVRKAGLLEAEKKYADAAAAYNSAARRQGMSPAQVAEAKLGVARCQQAQGDAATAEKAYRELIADKASGRLVLAGAWNGIADATKERGKTERSSDLLLEALFGYLRGSVQYAPGPGEPTSEYERSLAGAAQCFRFISELEQDPERRKLFAERAKERKAQLEREFPNSTFLREL